MGLRGEELKEIRIEIEKMLDDLEQRVIEYVDRLLGMKLTSESSTEKKPSDNTEKAIKNAIEKAVNAAVDNADFSELAPKKEEKKQVYGVRLCINDKELGRIFDHLAKTLDELQECYNELRSMNMFMVESPDGEAGARRSIDRFY